MSSKEIDALFARTLTGEYEDHESWKAVHELRRIGTREVFLRAAGFCKSTNPLVRARGLDVLAQLGRSAEHPTNNFPAESFAIVSDLVQRESELQPLCSAIAALGFLGNPRAVPLIIQHRTHPDSSIRFAVACSLGDYPNEPRSAEALLALMEDSDDEVRDWATFGLGVQGDLDSPEIRDALLRRLEDSNPDACEEAMAALGKRHDERVLPFLMGALKSPSVAPPVLEAACEMLGMDRENDGWKPADYAASLCRQFKI